MVSQSHITWQCKVTACTANMSWLLDNHGGRWDTCNETVCKRISNCWASGSLEPFFVNGRKMQVAGFMKGGLALRQWNSSENDVLLCRAEEAPLVLNVDYWLGSAGEMHIDVYRLSGTNVLHRVFPQRTTWWQLSNVLYEEQNLCHIQFVLRDTMIHRPNFFQFVLDDLQEIDDNILLPPPVMAPFRRPAAKAAAAKAPAAKAPAAKAKARVLKKPASNRSNWSAVCKRGVEKT